MRRTKPKPEPVKPLVLFANGERLLTVPYSRKTFQRFNRQFILRRISGERYEVCDVRKPLPIPKPDVYDLVPIT